MRTLDLLDYLLEIAKRLDFEVREEWLGGVGGGGCELKGQRILFVDLSLTPGERIAQVVIALKDCSDLGDHYLLPEAKVLFEAA